MKSYLSSMLVVTVACVLLAPMGGCPLPDDGDPNTTTPVVAPKSDLTWAETGFEVWHSASLEVGEDLIAYGTGQLTGVSYFVPSQNPTTPTAVPGTYRSTGFAIAHDKLLLADNNSQLTVFDPATATATVIPDTTINLSTIPADDDDDWASPIVSDGGLAITVNRADEVTDGHVLKLVDVSGSEPVVTALIDPPVNPSQVVIDTEEQVVVMYGADAFYMYDLTQPGAAPIEFDLSEQDGIINRFAYDSGQMIYAARSSLDNLRVLNTSTGTSTVLAENPGNRDQAVAINGGTFAYFLARSANNYDTYADPPTSSTIMYRACIGAAATLAVTEAAVAGGDPNDNEPGWWGYGVDLGITPDGSYIFMSGNRSIDELTEHLQVSVGGPFQVFVDGTDYLNASDVDVSATLVAFKTGTLEDTTVGYLTLPQASAQ